MTTPIYINGSSGEVEFRVEKFDDGSIHIIVGDVCYAVAATDIPRALRPTIARLLRAFADEVDLKEKT